MNLKGLDVIATRLWLDQSLPTRFPANVLAGFEPGVGGTYFNLSELQVWGVMSAAAATAHCCQFTSVNVLFTWVNCRVSCVAG